MAWEEILLYLFLSQAVSRGIDFAWKKLKGSHSEAQLKELKELEAKHKKLQTDINRSQNTVSQQFSRLQPLLTQITNNALHTADLAKLSNLLRELAAQTSSMYIEEEIASAYDGLDKEQLESHAYRYFLPESEKRYEHFVYTESGAPPTSWIPLFLGRSNRNPEVEDTIDELRRTEWEWHMPNPPLHMPQELGGPPPSRRFIKSHTLRKASLENQRLFRHLKEIFNNPDLPEHHPDSDPNSDFGYGRFNDTDLPEGDSDRFFGHCKWFYKYRSGVTDCLKSLHHMFFDFQTLVIHIANSDPEIGEILKANKLNKLCDPKLKILKELIKSYREKQVFIQDWVESTALMLADDSISDEHRVVSAEDLISVDDFLGIFDVCLSYSDMASSSYSYISDMVSRMHSISVNENTTNKHYIRLTDVSADMYAGGAGAPELNERFLRTLLAFENLETPNTLTAETPPHRTDAIGLTSKGYVYPSENDGLPSTTRQWHLFRRGEQSINPLKRSLLRSREERIAQLCIDLKVTADQKKELKERISVAYTANFQSWLIVKKAVDQWDWNLEGQLPPLWLFNTVFGYRSPKQITEENIDNCLSPIFQTRIRQ